VYLGSLGKLTKKEQLDLWCKKQPGEYIDSAKIDGCSALYELENAVTGAPPKLSTRGRDGVGIDIAHLLPFIKLPARDTTADGMVLGVRGELVILTSQFARLQEERRVAGLKPLTDPRSTVAGMCTGKTIDLRTCKYISFIAYQAFTRNWTRLEKPSRQFALLQELGFTVPWFRLSPSGAAAHDFDEVTRTTLALKTELDYPIDGLVLAQDIETDVPEVGKDPAYARAFKVGGTCASRACKRLAHFPLSPRKLCCRLLEQPGYLRR
jgi:DNA ligase (NAD+)